jgi:tetratricopeptide (TPR) repeat protein
MRRFVIAALVAGCGGGAAQQQAAPTAPKPAETAAMRPPEEPEVTVTSKSAEAVAHFKQGRQLLENQRAAESIEHFKKAVELDPDFALATAYLANVTPGTEGAKLAEHAVELARAIPEPERKLIEADAALRRGEREKAKQLLREVAAAKPRDARIQNALATLAFADENWDEAIDAGKKAVALDPKNQTAYNNIAYGAAWTGHYDDAIAVAQQQVALAPDEPNPHDTLGEILLAANRLDDALAEFQTAVAKDEKFTLALVAVAEIKMFKGDWKGGYETLKRAHDTAPRLGDAFEAAYVETWALAGQGKWGDCFRVYDAMDKAAADAKNDTARAFLATNRAVMFAVAGKGKDARKQADAALAKLKELTVTPATARNVRFDAQFARVLADWKLKDRADIDKAYAAMEDEAKAGDMNAGLRTTLQTAKGLVAWTKGNAKAAVAELDKCSQLDYLCRYTKMTAQRAAGDKMGESETRALLKASPRRDGPYVYVWAQLK